MRHLKGGRAFLSLLAVVLFPLLLHGAERPQGRYIVIIDPGHGGHDEGVRISENVYEKDITLKIASELQKELQAKGNITAQLTRPADRDVSLADRSKMVKSAGAALLISIHVNAGFGKKAAGYEVYFPGFDHASTKKDGAIEIIKDMAGNKHLNESVALAQNILRNLQNVFPREDRGLREAPVPIVEGLSMPAVVVEIGFATNAEDKKIITDGTGQRAVAQALNNSIREFLHLN